MFVHRIVGTVLAYVLELSCVYSVCTHICFMAETVAHLCQSTSLMISCLLLLPWCTAITGYQISNNNSNTQQQLRHWPQTYKQIATGWESTYKSENYPILYLRSEDDIPVILCTGLSITTILAGEWLNSLIFHGDIKCITANGWMIIYVDQLYVWLGQRKWTKWAHKISLYFSNLVHHN